jgi:hypothetical protein
VEDDDGGGDEQQDQLRGERVAEEVADAAEADGGDAAGPPDDGAHEERDVESRARNKETIDRTVPARRKI